MFTPPVTALVTSVPTDADVIVLGLADDEGTLVVLGADAVNDAFSQRFGADIATLATTLGASSKPGTAVALPGTHGVLVVTGVGDVDVTPQAIRRAAAAGVRAASATAPERAITVALSLGVTEPETVAAAVEGALGASYRYLKPGADATIGVRSIRVVAPSETEDAVTAAVATAAGVVLARDWVNTPANVLYPETFAESARETLATLPVDVEILDEDALREGGFGGILMVGQGSVRPPRLLHATYAPAGATTHLALIGKGMTFDAGGLDLKTQEGMYTMKCDMGGGAAVLGALHAIATLGLPIKVSAYVSMAENMPSGSAYRPSDVLTMHGGQTVENANSDAEGRLVMADALDWAGESQPDFMIDIATLTGACMVALGSKTIGVMSTSDEAAERLLDAAEVSGEAMWQLPITDEAFDNLASDVADLKSSGARQGGALTAAAFLSKFVPEGTPWAHLDIAGPAWADKDDDDVTKGGTGAGVRTLVALARTLAA